MNIGNFNLVNSSTLSLLQGKIYNATCWVPFANMISVLMLIGS